MRFARHIDLGNTFTETKEGLVLTFSGKDWIFEHHTALAALPFVPGTNYIEPNAEPYMNDADEIFSTEVIPHVYKTFIGCPQFVNHDDKRVVGIILDAVIRPIRLKTGEIIQYVDLFAATNRAEEPETTEQLITKTISGYSMGCMYTPSICSICGQKLIGNDEFLANQCTHLDPVNIGHKFLCDDGHYHAAVSVLCDAHCPDGKYIETDDHFLEFIECSIVTNEHEPAFKGAAVHEVYDLPDASLRCILPLEVKDKDGVKYFKKKIGA